jgi:hypothetical protein
MTPQMQWLNYWTKMNTELRNVYILHFETAAYCCDFHLHHCASRTSLHSPLHAPLCSCRFSLMTVAYTIVRQQSARQVFTCIITRPEKGKPHVVFIVLHTAEYGVVIYMNHFTGVQCRSNLYLHQCAGHKAFFLFEPRFVTGK